jgi:hypothetical protein
MNQYPKVARSEEVLAWFKTALARHFRSDKVLALHSNRINLSNLLGPEGCLSLFPQGNLCMFKVTVAAAILGDQNQLALLQYTPRRPAIEHVGELVTLSRIAKPVLSLLVSPRPPRESLRMLLSVYGRYDVLEYGENKRIGILQWDPDRATPLYPMTIPPGGFPGAALEAPRTERD